MKRRRAGSGACVEAGLNFYSVLLCICRSQATPRATPTVSTRCARVLRRLELSRIGRGSEREREGG
eukprot:4591936-Pleurochrysis_carterae.AAC.1